jgi:hypothetical protein
MTLLGKLVPLVVLFIVLAFAAFVGYAAYTIATDIADKTSKKMEKKNVSFGKEGMKIGVKEIKTENYVDQTQKYGTVPLPRGEVCCGRGGRSKTRPSRRSLRPQRPTRLRFPGDGIS